MSDRQEKYFQFPLFLMRPLLSDPLETLNNIFIFGFFRYAYSIQLTKDQIADRVIYAWVNNKLTVKLRKILIDYEYDGRIVKYVDYNGFGSLDREYNPEDQREQLLELFNENDRLFNLSYEYARIETAIYNLKAFYECPVYETIREYESWYNGLTVPDKEPFPQINISLLIDYIQNKHTDYDFIQLAAFIGINSIIGKAQYKRTNKAHIVARMLGYKSKNHLPAGPLPLFEKYMKRYQFDRLKTTLQLFWNLLFESRGIHGYYIGNAGKIDLVSLKVAVKGKQLINKKAELKEKEKQAEALARQRIKTELTTP
jgi:hypothetical protein